MPRRAGCRPARRCAPADCRRRPSTPPPPAASSRAGAAPRGRRATGLRPSTGARPRPRAPPRPPVRSAPAALRLRPAGFPSTVAITPDLCASRAGRRAVDEWADASAATGSSISPICMMTDSRCSYAQLECRLPGRPASPGAGSSRTAAIAARPLRAPRELVLGRSRPRGGESHRGFRRRGMGEPDPRLKQSPAAR
jgi:hypothetical protein